MMPTETISCTYRWNFGDGTEGQGAQVAHAYLAGGTFTVKLYVTEFIGGPVPLHNAVVNRPACRNIGGAGISGTVGIAVTC